MAGEVQTPVYSQSMFCPPPSLGTRSCQRNLPSASLKQRTVPKSSWKASSRGEPLLVPTKILPPPTVGLPYAWLPSLATHFTFLLFERSRSSAFSGGSPTSASVGRFFSSEIMLRAGVPP